MIAVVIPTIRPESFKKFLEAWQHLFDKHNCTLVVVQDGENPTVNGKSAAEVMGEYQSSLTNFNAGIRNLGFAYVAKELKECEIILTLDDDVTPIGDPIQEHINALQNRVPVSWISTAYDYTRGFPYSIRDEAEVVISHGVWEGSGDWDAPTHLVLGEKRKTTYYRGPIPKGIYYPMCSMNLAFKRKVLPYIFHAPWALGIHRFDDIFAGIVSKQEIDKLGWAAVSGYAVVNHERASDPFQNLKNEAPGIELNEKFWLGDNSHPYFKIYSEKYDTWKKFMALHLDTYTTEELTENDSTPEAQDVKTEEIIAPPIDSKDNQLKFWLEWLKGNGKAFERTGRLHSRFDFMLKDKKEATIANLGAGPMNLIGDFRRKININVIPSDILANEYAELLIQTNLNPHIKVEQQDMENLQYDNNSVDIVYCANALTYTTNPQKALKEMLRVCKPGGYIYLRHVEYGDSGQYYGTKTQWVMETNDKEECILRPHSENSQNTGFKLADISQGFKTSVESLAKGMLITSVLQKTE